MRRAGKEEEPSHLRRPAQPVCAGEPCPRPGARKLLLSTSDKRGAAFIERGGGGGEWGWLRDRWKLQTHYNLQTGTNCQSLWGNKRGFLCFIHSSECGAFSTTLPGCNNIIIINNSAGLLGFFFGRLAEAAIESSVAFFVPNLQNQHGVAAV